MSEIFVVAEHRQGEMREITYEMLYRAGALCDANSFRLTSVILGGGDEPFIGDLKKRSDRVIFYRHERLATFNAELYKQILQGLLQEHHPLMTFIGHTSWGMGYAPSLSVRTGYPLATDCVDIRIQSGRPTALRQVYSGKVFSKVSFRESEGYLLTIRSGASVPPDAAAGRNGEVLQVDITDGLPEPRSKSLDLVDTGAGEVDIAQADFLISIGRGVGGEENISGILELADLMGGTLSCSRPIVDKNWLPKYHQVGTSGKSVKPKVYFALGISGAFQHVAGIGGAGTIIAVNKDKKAPIFRIADYGIVEDLFKVADALKERLASKE
jgi:electron transfer flavoprotein alpha subunit